MAAPVQPVNSDPVNILLVDDQPAKLLSYEVVLSSLGETLIKAGSAREALGHLLKTDVAVILLDVSMPELDGFELASMIREHPRFRQTAIIFVSAIQVTEIDSLRGYEAGAVDYVPVPVVPEVLRAKVRVFAELYRKTRQLERLNSELERRVSERTAALEATAARLRETEQRRDLAMAAGRMGSWEWDMTADTYVWDAGQFRIFGVDSNDFQPTPPRVMALVHPEDRDRIQSDLSAASEMGSYHSEFRICRPDGELRWCMSSGAATLDEAGRCVRLSGITYDITDRKLAERALQEINHELEQRVEERTREREAALAQLFEAQKLDTIGQLTGGVAHDFNNLLMAVLGSLELLKKRLDPEDSRSQRLLDNAVQGAERGAALTQRLLAFARRQELKPETVEIVALFAGMRDLLTRSLGPAVILKTDLPDDLPPVCVDPHQLELAILNLAVNARDAMPAGGSLLLRGRDLLVRPGDPDVPPNLAPGPYIRLEVIDSGLGMDDATLARATEPFFTTKGLGKGTGLGLSMVQGLAVQSGGAMTVSSEIGAGTNIELWLPQPAQTEDRPTEPDRPSADKDEPDICGPELTILVVDDDLLVSAGTAAMVEDLGHHAVEASSGPQALEAIRTGGGAIDLVITDQAMPGMTGVELAERIRELDPELPIILASGYAEIPQGEAAISLPKLGKPFRQADLARMLRSVADQRLILPRGGTGERPRFSSRANST